LVTVPPLCVYGADVLLDVIVADVSLDVLVESEESEQPVAKKILMDSNSATTPTTVMLFIFILCI
jgi:hypothetical protein